MPCRHSMGELNGSPLYFFGCEHFTLIHLHVCDEAIVNLDAEFRVQGHDVRGGSVELKSTHVLWNADNRLACMEIDLHVIGEFQLGRANQQDRGSVVECHFSCPGGQSQPLPTYESAFVHGPLGIG